MYWSDRNHSNCKISKNIRDIAVVFTKFIDSDKEFISIPIQIQNFSSLWAPLIFGSGGEILSPSELKSGCDFRFRGGNLKRFHTRVTRFLPLI